MRTHAKAILVPIFICLVTFSFGQTITFIGGGNICNGAYCWDDPANWSTGVLPTSSDQVTLAANCEINIDITMFSQPSWINTDGFDITIPVDRTVMLAEINTSGNSIITVIGLLVLRRTNNRHAILTLDNTSQFIVEPDAFFDGDVHLFGQSRAYNYGEIRRLFSTISVEVDLTPRASEIEVHDLAIFENFNLIVSPYIIACYDTAELHNMVDANINDVYQFFLRNQSSFFNKGILNKIVESVYLDGMFKNHISGSVLDTCRFIMDDGAIFNNAGYMKIIRNDVLFINNDDTTISFTNEESGIINMTCVGSLLATVQAASITGDFSNKGVIVIDGDANSSGLSFRGAGVGTYINHPTGEIHILNTLGFAARIADDITFHNYGIFSICENIPTTNNCPLLLLETSKMINYPAGEVYSDIDLFGTDCPSIPADFTNNGFVFNYCATYPDLTCHPSYVLAGVQTINEDYETFGIIQSEQTIPNGVTVDYDAKLFIDLLPDFSTTNGCIFNAFIDGCGGF